MFTLQNAGKVLSRMHLLFIILSILFHFIVNKFLYMYNMYIETIIIWTTIFISNSNVSRLMELFLFHSC